VALCGPVLPAFATLPLLIHMPDLSVSPTLTSRRRGPDTTGSTVLSGLDKLRLP